jgi:transcriptional regulator with XRE-family HTH domain
MRETGDAEIDQQLLQFGRNIRAARERVGLPQDKLGLDRAAVSFLERAERSPDLPTIVRVAHAVGVKPAALLKDVGLVSAAGPRLDGDVPGDPAGRFGANLLWARDRAGISQEALAFAANVDRAAISVFENGRRDPNLRTILKLARALELAPAALLRGIAADGAPPKSAARRRESRRG